MQHSLRQLKNHGFTIIELLVVIVVIGILVGISVVSYNGVQQTARDKALLSDTENVSSELARYSAKNGGTYGTAVAWYSGGGATNTNINFTPTSGNIIDVVTNTADYCIRGYNPASNSKTVTTASVKESTPGACVGLQPSVAAGGSATTANSLVGWWAFNGSAKETINGMNGTVNGATLATGEGGDANTAYAFNGTSNYISLSSSTPLNFTNSDFTVNVWVNTGALAAAGKWYDILSSSSSDWSVGINGYVNATGYLRMTKVNQVDGPQPATAVSQTGWHMLTTTYHTTGTNTAQIAYYMDGQSVGTAAWNYSAQGTFASATKTIGARLSGTNGFFKGSMDDLRVYSRVISSTDVQTLYGFGAQ